MAIDDSCTCLLSSMQLSRPPALDIDVCLKNKEVTVNPKPQTLEKKFENPKPSILNP